MKILKDSIIKRSDGRMTYDVEIIDVSPEFFAFIKNVETTRPVKNSVLHGPKTISDGNIIILVGLTDDQETQISQFWHKGVQLEKTDPKKEIDGWKIDQHFDQVRYEIESSVFVTALQQSKRAYAHERTADAVETVQKFRELMTKSKT